MNLTNFIPSEQSCLPYKCGFDPLNTAARLACGEAGYAGVLSCMDQRCQPYCPAQQVAQQIQQTAPTPPILDTRQVLPDITAQPCPEVQPCSVWCEVNNAIAQNPLMAGAVLVGLAFVLLGGNR